MDPALWELLRAEAGTDGNRELEAVIRLATPGIEIPGVRIVARFGPIATCRIQARDVIGVRARPDVLSVKAARGLSPGSDPGAVTPDPGDPVIPMIKPTDVRRGPELGPDGTGVVVAAVDWGADVDAAVFRRPDGATRFLALWDQRDQASGARLQPYGYGAVHRRDDIDRALRDPRPYERLGYHPAIADPRGQGTHGTRTLDIAAGNGRSGGPLGIAPQADLLFVHLADRNTGGLANFGDSVRLLEAVDFISRTAGSQPCAINISAGRVCGPKDGTTLVEQALDELLASTPGRFVVNSAGNYYRWRTHSRGVIGPGETRPLTFVSEPADVTVNELEIWYDGGDELAVRVEPPGYSAGPPVRLGERADLLADGRLVGRIYHRRHDPNNGANHVVAYLDPIGLAGTWTVILEGRQVSNGRFDAWIERDDSCPGCQARFPPETSSTAITIGSIASSHLPLVVGAVDGHDPARPPASFSSAGPSRDGRDEPNLVAPGVRILAARSAPAGAQYNPGLLVSGSGTSFATPHVTGAVALCLEVAGSRLSAAEIRALVLGSCDPAPAPGLEDRLGHGYLNIPRLVASVQQSVHAAGRPHHAKEPAMVPEDTLQLLTDNPALAYREYLYRPRGQLGRWVSDWFEPLAGPAQSLGRPPRAGDVLLEVTLGRPGPGRCAVLAPGDLEPLAAQRRLAPGQLLLRPRPRTEITVPQPAEPPADGDLGWFSPPDDAGLPDETEGEPEAEYDPGEAGDQAGPPIPVDAAAAVPPVTPAERATVTQPLLSPQASARAVAWNAQTHPAASGVSLDQIRAALDSYVDATAVRAALDRDSAAGSEPDAVLAECVHQFQRKCYREQREHDGRAGQSALDSLGLIERSGPALHSGLRHNARAQQRLNQHDAQVQAATGGQFSAASWFSGIVDPAVFGLRTKGGHGLHVLLVRKLRAAERYLLTLPRFHGMTPVALAATLGLSERHGGMRAAQTDSMHTFGLAVDIEYTANPWPHQRASWQAMKRAATLVSGVSLHHDSAPAYFSSLGSNPALSTGQIWDELHQRHTELVRYFRLGQDPAALKTALLASQARGTAGLTHAGEPVDEAVTRWQSQITEDRHALAAPDEDFTGRDPAKGFLTHDRDLVIALRDHGCLAWGAVDQGPAGRGSGDMMHFDARIDGAGCVLAWPAARPAAQGPINFLPAPGHHPCLPSSAAAAPAEATLADADDGPTNQPANAEEGADSPAKKVNEYQPDDATTLVINMGSFDTGITGIRNYKDWRTDASVPHNKRHNGYRTPTDIIQIVLHETSADFGYGFNDKKNETAHLAVQRDATIKQFNDLVERENHTIGLNPTSIGIEFVNRDWLSSTTKDGGEGIPAHEAALTADQKAKYAEAKGHIWTFWGYGFGIYKLPPADLAQLEKEVELLSWLTDSLQATINSAPPQFQSMFPWFEKTWLQLVSYNDVKDKWTFPADHIPAAADQATKNLFVYTTGWDVLLPAQISGKRGIISHNATYDGHPDGSFLALYTWLRMAKGKTGQQAFDLCKSLMKNHWIRVRPKSDSSNQVIVLDVSDRNLQNPGTAVPGEEAEVEAEAVGEMHELPGVTEDEAGDELTARTASAPDLAEAGLAGPTPVPAATPTSKMGRPRLPRRRRWSTASAFRPGRAHGTPAWTERRSPIACWC